MTEKEDFVHLHVHSDMSQLDGCGKLADYVKKAVERGNPALATTEHGSMRGYHQLMLNCTQNNLKPIYGVEFYVSNDMNRKGLTDEERTEISKGMKRADAKAAIREYEERHGIRDRWHLTVWAKDNVGLRNLYKLTSAAWSDGFYYKPRIDMPSLYEHKQGLIVATGCQSSVVYDRVLGGKRKTALETAEQMREQFGEDLWLEVQPHDMADQITANKFALELKGMWGDKARLLATQDAHYVDPEDHEHHDVLLCIGTNDKMSNPERFKFDVHGFHFKTRKEMEDSFHSFHPYMNDELVKESCDNTVALADCVQTKIEIDRFKCLLPEVGLPPGFASELEYIKKMCVDGWTWREIPKRAEAIAKRDGVSYEHMIKKYAARLKHELTIIHKQKFTGYFLIVRDLYDWVRTQDIMCGPGRGSAAGSLVSFLLGITSIDPIEHALLFERFISPDRIDMPDIDMDFEDVRRQDIIEHLRERYGHDKVCQIATIGKLSGKQCLKDVSRVLEVPLMEVNQVTNSIIERSSGDERASQTIEDSFREFKVCREFNAKYPAVLRHARKLEGMAKNLGIHASAVVASPVTLTDIIPMETRIHEGEHTVVSAADMYAVQDAGLLKLDVLGLRTLSVLKQALKAIKDHTGIDIDMEKDIELNEKSVLDGFTAHDYVGIFQYDSPGADKVCAGVTFELFEDVAAMTALNRPGTSRSGLSAKYVERKKNPKLISKSAFHPKVSEITKDTLGIIVYQEHVIRIFTEIAGFPPASADNLRRKIAKKWGVETLEKERERFIEGAVRLTEGMTTEMAGKLMDAITFFGSYGFNKSHATAYGMIAYWGMYLKLKYPLEFYWALMCQEPSRQKVQQIVKDAKKHGIEILPPDVSISKDKFSMDMARRAIRGSLVDIKGVGDAASASIMANQPYSNFADFLESVDRRKAHKGVVCALARSGALDELIPNVKWFVEHIEDVWKEVGKKDFSTVTEMLHKSKGEVDYTKEEKQFEAATVSPLAFGKHPVDAYADFIENHIKVPVADMSDEDFYKTYDGGSCYIVGAIIEIKYNQVGDFHSGELPSEKERIRMGWGNRYAKVNVEDKGGKQNRVTVDWDIFDEYRDIIDKGIGTAVLVHASVNAKYEKIKSHFIIDMAEFRRKVNAVERLSVWEKIVSGAHPASTFKWKDDATKQSRTINNVYRQNMAAGISRFNFKYCGVITHLKTKLDKNDLEMGFFGLIGADQLYIDAICFGSMWPSVKPHVHVGDLVRIELEHNKDSNIFDGGMIKILAPASKPALPKKEEGEEASC